MSWITASGGLASYNVTSANNLITVSTTTSAATLTASTSPTFTNLYLTNALSMVQGGTGTTTAATIQGQVLSFDGSTYRPTNLVAGASITITTSTPGTITIATTGLQAAITAGTNLSFSGATLNFVGFATTTVNTLSFVGTSATTYYLNPEHLIYPFYIENPAANENDGLWIANATTTITKILCVNTKGTTDSANVNLIWDSSAATATSSAASKVFTDFTSCNATTTPMSMSINGSSTVPTNFVLRFITSTASTSGMTLSIFGRDNQ
jgi:hypothetical protein